MEAVLHLLIAHQNEMAITTKQQRQQRRSEALQLIADGVPPTDAATQLTVKWGVQP